MDHLSLATIVPLHLAGHEWPGREVLVAKLESSWIQQLTIM